jgi:glycerophosphoryl diester phosphodiesterase
MTIVTPAVLACVTLLGAADDTDQTLPFFEPIQPPRKLQAMAHRGAKTRAPENTAAAIERSIADTVEWVEIDVRLTRDGQHVLLHDATLEGQTSGVGRVREHSLAEIQALDAGAKFASRFAGQRVLTLDEGLKLARGRVNLCLDCKDVDTALLAREVVAANMAQQVIICGDLEMLKAVRASGDAALPLMTKWRPEFGVHRWPDQVHLAAVEIDAVDVTPEVCAAFHGFGIKVQAKTLGAVDDRPEVWDRVSSAGVDWVQSDRPEEVVAWSVHKTLRPGRVMIAHHRGASQFAPENTLPALRKAIALGADFVEFDVHTTRDGALVLLHDGTLDRTTSGHGPIKDRTAEEVRALDAGSWFGRPFQGAKVPTLDEFLDAAGHKVELYFDAKDITPEALVDALKRHGVSDRAVVYQSAKYLERLLAIAPEIRRMPPLGNPDAIDALAERVKPYAFDTRWSILSKTLIDRCHAKGIKVFSDAIGRNETVEQYEHSIRIGIDLIQTDHPLRVLRALELLDRPR